MVWPCEEDGEGYDCQEILCRRELVVVQGLDHGRDGLIL